MSSIRVCESGRVNSSRPLFSLFRLKLCAFVFCLFIFMGSHLALAHTDPHMGIPVDTTSYDVSEDRRVLPKFVQHAAVHLFGASSFSESLGLLNDFREQGGDWFHDDKSYLIILTKRGGVYLHAKQRELEDQNWSGDLVGCNGEAWSDLMEKKVGCVKYKDQEVTEKNPAGRIFVTGGPFVPFTKPGSTDEEFVIIGGLDYTPEPITYSTFDEMLDGIVDSLFEFTGTPLTEENRRRFRTEFEDVAIPTIDASNVDTEDDLREFLADAISLVTASIGLPKFFDPVILRSVFRFEGGPWRSGSTYIYIMDDIGNVVFNGANRNIEQTDLWNFKDGDDPFIQRILDAAAGQGTGCSENGLLDKPYFVCYNWDDPSIEGDEPIVGGGAGGTSSKLAYAVQHKEGEERTYVFGTGLYLEFEVAEAEEETGSDGCSIAGTDATATAGNFEVNFLSVLLLVSAVLLGSRFRTSKREKT